MHLHLYPLPRGATSSTYFPTRAMLRSVQPLASFLRGCTSAWLGDLCQDCPSSWPLQPDPPPPAEIWDPKTNWEVLKKDRWAPLLSSRVHTQGVTSWLLDSVFAERKKLISSETDGLCPPKKTKPLISEAASLWHRLGVRGVSSSGRARKRFATTGKMEQCGKVQVGSETNSELFMPKQKVFSLSYTRTGGSCCLSGKQGLRPKAISCTSIAENKALKNKNMSGN